MNMSEIHCCGGNKAENICCTITCNQEKGALICLSQDCQCNTLHEKCSINFPIKKISRALNQKGKSYLPILQRLVCFYDNVIKLMSIQKENIFKIMQELSLALDQQSKEFFVKLKKGENILAKESVNTVNSLLNQPSFNIQEIRNRLDDHEMQFQNQLNNMVVCLEKYEQFRQTFSVNSILEIKEEMKEKKQSNVSTQLKKQKQIFKPEFVGKTQIQVNIILKCQKSIAYCDNFFFLTMLAPNLNILNFNKYRSFKFKIKKYSAGPYVTLFFGIYIKQLGEKSLIDYNFKAQIRSQNFYAIAGNKKIYSSGLTIASEIQIQQNDNIQLDFDPLNKRMIFTRNNQQYTALNMHYTDNDQLTLFVGFQKEGQQVQYFGQYDQFGKKI